MASSIESFIDSGAVTPGVIVPPVQIGNISASSSISGVAT